jgi:hypothetical protein
MKLYVTIGKVIKLTNSSTKEKPIMILQKFRPKFSSIGKTVKVLPE